MSKVLTVRGRRRPPRVKKINLRLSNEEVRVLSKLAFDSEGLDPKERVHAINAGRYIEAKLTIRERGASSFDDDEFG